MTKRNVGLPWLVASSICLFIAIIFDFSKFGASDAIFFADIALILSFISEYKATSPWNIVLIIISTGIIFLSIGYLLVSFSQMMSI